MDEAPPAVQVDHLTHRYESRVALDELTLQVRCGEIFGLLGPNGSGKTTLFRILATLIPPTAGSAQVFGRDVVRERLAVRRSIAVVFQSPSLDLALTAEENLRHHGHLYGLRGESLARRIEQVLGAFGIADRARDRTGRLSGGLRRRVELAKGMLTRPRLLLMDEPDTGLDPAARLELRRLIERLRDEEGLTLLFTTHLMDEADRCDRLAILDRGRLRACDTPEAMKDRIGGDVIVIVAGNPLAVREQLRERFGVEGTIVDGALRLERHRGHEFVPQIIEALPTGAVSSISVGRPTLEDVFVSLTGRAMREDW